VTRCPGPARHETGFPVRQGDIELEFHVVRAAFALAILRLEQGRLTDIAAFEQPSMFAAFGLPASL
jgi:hypothetical protein